MKAGFARVKINPAVGTRMTGFGRRDREQPCTGIHDDIYVRALYLEHEGKEALIMGFDLLFFSRDEADRFKGAIGRYLDLRPSEILLNTSHSHAGPKVGTWLYDPPSDLFYLQELEYGLVEAARSAKASAVEATLHAGMTKSALPLNRRAYLSDGKVDRTMRPNPDMPVCDALPVCLVKSKGGEPVCLLFSVSCHPSTISTPEISAEWPGVAMRLLDEHLGKTASLFLQGTGGDAKPSVMNGGNRFRPGKWEDVEISGKMVADEVKDLLGNLVNVEPDLHRYAVESSWRLEPVRNRKWFEAVRNDPGADRTTKLWAEENLAVLDRGYTIPDTVPVTIHGIKLGDGLRLVGLEGEAVGELGLLVLDLYREGVTFPMGYTDGAQAYLPNDRMLDEGGYEVVSFYEYRRPAGFAKGIEKTLTDALRQLQAHGVK